eukprot:6212263-Pleurochrysis_carterae.AAC.3
MYPVALPLLYMRTSVRLERIIGPVCIQSWLAHGAWVYSVVAYSRAQCSTLSMVRSITASASA